MAKQKGKAAAKLTAGVDKVVAAIAGALESVETGGNVVTQVCNIAKQIFRGEPVPAHDAEYIANEVAKRRGWSEVSARPRKSDVRTLLSTYDRLPAAVTAYKKKSPTFSWHTAMLLARSLKSNAPTKAVAITLGKAKSKVAVKMTPAHKLGMAVGIIKKLDTRSPNIIAFRAAFATLCKKYSINY